MTSLTLQLPPRLARALAAQNIDEAQAQQIALAALEFSVTEGKGQVSLSPAGEVRAFARRLIDDNRPLFEELARR